MPSGDPLVLELGPSGGALLRIEWDAEALRELSATSHDPGGRDARPIWRLEQDPDWDGASALRVISASFDDGALLGVAALRPREAAGHDADAVGAILVSPDGEVALPTKPSCPPSTGRTAESAAWGWSSTKNPPTLQSVSSRTGSPTLARAAVVSKRL